MNLRPVWLRQNILAALGGSASALALLAGLFVLKAGVGIASEAPQLPVSEALPASQAGVEQLLGEAAERCVFARPDHRLCSWQVEGRLVRPITRGGVGDGDRVRIVCELPLREGAAGVCHAHAEGESRLPSVSSANSPGDPFASLATIGALSHALGDIPESCSTHGGAQLCSWPLPPGTAASDAVASDAEDVQLRCLLPLDGSPRADDSCEVVAPD
jgi:hypothetical protein